MSDAVTPAEEPEAERDKGGRPPKITADAVDLCVEMLSRRCTKSAIKAALKKQYNITARSCETVLARARARMLKRSGQTREDHRADALAFYESIIRDMGDPGQPAIPPVTDPDTGEVIDPGRPLIPPRPAPTAREKLVAQERIDKLLGLEVPQRVELAGAGGGPIKAIIGVDVEEL